MKKLNKALKETTGYKSANEIKREWNDQYPNISYERSREFFIVRSPNGVELERYVNVPTLGWYAVPTLGWHRGPIKDKVK